MIGPDVRDPSTGQIIRNPHGVCLAREPAGMAHVVPAGSDRCSVCGHLADPWPRDETEKPFNVRVAEALGWTELKGVFDIWMGRPSALCVSLEQGGDRDVRWLRRFVPGNLSPDAPLVAVSNYDTDWSATGPLIERLGLSLDQFWGDTREEHWVASYGGGYEQGIHHGQGPTPLIAVCNLLLTLHAAGKLPLGDVSLLKETR